TSPNYKRVLIISAEKMSSMLTMKDRKVDVLFGDGAAAIILEKDKNAIFYSSIGLDAEYIDILKVEEIEQKSRRINMKGQDVYKYAVNKMSDLASTTLNKNNLSYESIDYLITHQANARIIESVAQKLNFPAEKVIISVDEHANTSSASIPLALSSLAQKNLLSGKTILSLAVGAGMTYGSAIFQVQ
ncbi:MAG: 3-oxoacyl-[acyl-carrier-protein] synthase III C-terminal domain-containing protein, partial [Rickettsiaceae bacterium]|nr:3-oxoacyl-[acyl-carrier-protein] synthase III C-terminal domain-containing protein [Rickettsiaceae bacterium]